MMNRFSVPDLETFRAAAKEMADDMLRVLSSDPSETAMVSVELMLKREFPDRFGPEWNLRTELERRQYVPPDRRPRTVTTLCDQ